MPMMSWHPRMMDRKLLIFGPRGLTIVLSPVEVRMWKESGISSATGRGLPSPSWRKASLTSLPVSLGWPIRDAHFVSPLRIES